MVEGLEILVAPENIMPMMTQFATVLVFLGVGVVFVVISLIAAQLIRPSHITPEKILPYECGENAEGSPWIKFNVRFYVVAIIFLIFDVEIVFLLPWAVVFKQFVSEGLGRLAFIEGLVFILILAVGLAYVWAKGDLQWVRSEEREDF